MPFRPDYNSRYLATGERPQNFLMDTKYPDRFSGYPKLQKLTSEIDNLVSTTAHSPLGLRTDFSQFPYLGSKFDSILIDPPWLEYAQRSTVPRLVWDWQMLASLPIDSIAANPSFCFLWCGSRHVEEGMYCLHAWGFKRIEDICWVKTNKSGRVPKDLPINQDQVLFSTIEHCLVGMRGHLKRSIDTHAVLANVECDVILGEEPEDSSDTTKPDAIYDLIEHFSVGTRRIQLFGSDANLRPGWVTVGENVTESNFYPPLYNPQRINQTPLVHDLRPKSPNRSNNTRI